MHIVNLGQVHYLGLKLYAPAAGIQHTTLRLLEYQFFRS